MNGPSNPFTPPSSLQLDMPEIYGPGALPPGAVNPPRKAPKNVFHDNSIPLWSQWDVPSALAALDNHTLGQFYQSSLLADAMGIDDAYDAVINTRILGLISRPFTLVPSRRGDGRKAKLAHRILTERWDEIFPVDVLSQLMRTFIEMGFSPAQPIWRYDEKLLIPQIQVWHPSTIYYDIATRHYVANTMEGPSYMKPGDGKWILLTPWGSYRGWMRGAVRATSIPFLARQYALRDWARYNEVHGLPIKLAKVPGKASADDKQAFTQGIANLGNESTVMLPQGVGDKDGAESFDLALLEAKADTHESFLNLVTKCEERIAIRMLGQNLTTNVEGGSFAAANVHDRVRLDYVRFDAKAMGVLREQVLRAFCQFNFGDPDLAPELCWDTSPPEDKVSRATSLAQMSAALVNFATIKGSPVDMRKLLANEDVPLLPEGEEESAPALAPVAAPAGQPAEPKAKKAPAKPPPEKKEVSREVVELITATKSTSRKVKKLAKQVEALATKPEPEPVQPPAPVEPTFAQKNAAFLADLKDMRDLDLKPNLEELAAKHGVPVPQKDG